jgi:hypothetical protein
MNYLDLDVGLLVENLLYPAIISSLLWLYLDFALTRVIEVFIA